MISRLQMNRQFYNMGGEGMQEDYQMQDQQSMQDNQGMMQSSPQQMQAQPPQAQPQMDPQQALQIIVKMLMDEGIPQEEAIKIAKQMIQAVAQGGMQEVSDENRVQARFGGRMGYASGGIGRLVDREQYGFGSIFKGITKGISGAVKGVANVVKKVASSDLGKMALMAAAIYAGGGGFGLQPGGFSMFGNASGGAGLLGSGGQFGLGNSFVGQSLLGTPNFIGEYEGGPFSTVGNLFSGRSAGGFSKLLSGNTGSLIAGGAGLLTGALSGEQPEQQPGESMEDYNRRVEQWKTTLNANLQNTSGASRYQLPSSANNPYYGVRAANGGRIGYQGGGIGNIISEATQEGFFSQPQMPMMAQGGRMGYAAGSIFKGLTKLAKAKQTKLTKQLDEAFDLAASRHDFDFSDYKMRNDIMAEELAEIKYGKNYDDLNLNTRLDLYDEAFDYLNDKAADYGDTMYDAFKERGGQANGGRMGYAYGNSVQEGIMAAPQISNQMGMPVGNPRQNQSGVSELDYRDQGGFVPPIGIKEKEDDIPAMLSNNEFVFTADAVKNAGGGDPNVGAQKMYAMMKQLENGGMA
jgi:hypothetical protein